MFCLLEDEPGAGRVQEVLRRERTILPWLVLLEVSFVSQQGSGQQAADRRYALMRQLPCEILWHIDEPTMLTAAGLKAGHRLSLADSLIAAYALLQGAILLHKDPELAALESLLPLEALPYK